MKKFFLIGILIVFIVGCGRKEDNKMLVGSWKTIFSDNIVNLDDEKLYIFNNAKKDYTGMNLDVIALLGEQVVAGKNYMFLAKGYQDKNDNEVAYKIVVVYNNLENKAVITKVEDFDYTKYVNKKIDDTSSEITGGWVVYSPTKHNIIDENINKIFDNATGTLTGFIYNPIAVLGKQVVSGTNYAILCYGKASYENMKEGIYLITLYDDNNMQEIVSSAYINLADYNN